MRKNRISILLAMTATFLVGCSSETGFSQAVSGARSALSSIHLVEQSSRMGIRPSPALGTYVTLYLTQTGFVPYRTSLLGISAQQKMIEAQNTGARDEVFALLNQLGDLLQIDISDLLDRSDDRIQTLTDYTDTLRNTSIAAHNTQQELEVLLDEQNDSVREQRRASREIESAIRNALRDEDYHTAAGLQEDSIQAKIALADIETKQDQTDNLVDTLDELVDIAADRLNAIEKNREALLAGVKVTEVPGIEDLEILEQMRRARNQRDSVLFGE